MLPLRDLLHDLELSVVAGETGLDRAVRWVHSSELLDPTPWLSGGELLLTTGLQLTDDEVMRAYVARLAEHGLTGLGFGAGFGHEHVPQALCEAAGEHGFPVFEVPYEVPFIAITERAFSQLVNEQYAVLRRALAAHERLEKIVLSERGLDGVANGLGAMIGGPAVIIDARGAVLARRAGRAGLGPEVVRALGSELRERVQAGARGGYAPSAEGFPAGALALPVARGTTPVPEAWLVAAKDAGALSELDRLTLHQAVTIVALELLRRRVVDDTERRLAGDVLTALVAGDLHGAELTRRLGPFGLRERAGALVIAPPRGVRGVAEESLARALREETGGGLVAATGRFLCALEARALALNGDASAALATYRDLGSFQLLLSLQDDDALRLFCDSILAPIEDSEGAYGGELMRSLEAFIECNGQWERAAKALFCHRHTLRYRIRRVEELTGRSLDSARDRIDFWLALRGRELVQPERTRE